MPPHLGHGGLLVSLFLCLFVCLLVCLFVCLFICLFVCLSRSFCVCLFVFAGLGLPPFCVVAFAFVCVRGGSVSLVFVFGGARPRLAEPLQLSS